MIREKWKGVWKAPGMKIMVGKEDDIFGLDWCFGVFWGKGTTSQFYERYEMKVRRLQGDGRL